MDVGSAGSCHINKVEREMTEDSSISLGLVLCLVVVIATAIWRLPLPRSLSVLTLLALGLRVVGAFSYYGVIQAAYGRGDYNVYYRVALDYSTRLLGGDFSMFFDPGEWHGGRWWGTQFVFFPASLVIAIIGPNILSVFV